MSGASPGNAREHYSPMLFEELLESSPDAIIVTDLEGRITGADAGSVMNQPPIAMIAGNGFPKLLEYP
jgi:ABC-type hemin transport system substrate-binding protein